LCESKSLTTLILCFSFLQFTHLNNVAALLVVKIFLQKFYEKDLRNKKFLSQQISSIHKAKFYLNLH